MHLFSFIKIAGAFMVLFFLTSACSVFGVGVEQVTPTPMPTSSVPGLSVISPQACQIAERSMIRVEQPQGDLISWSPLAGMVAYIASTVGSSWNVGELNILTAPHFDTPERLATQAAGDLAWSPNATAIAYLSLRRSDNLYTIGLAYPDGRASKDLFPDEAARTDNFSSMKAIHEWIDESRLRVYISCGVDCMQGINVNPSTGLSTQIGDSIQPAWDLWSVHTNRPAIIPLAFSDLAGDLNWSPDERLIAYTDENGFLWIINVESGNLYPLDIGTYGTVTETDWSYDSRYLAVKADQTLKIFSFQCP